MRDVLQFSRHASSRDDAQIELAKASKIIRPIHATTRDADLERLLQEAERYFNREDPDFIVRAKGPDTCNNLPNWNAATERTHTELRPTLQ